MFLRNYDNYMAALMLGFASEDRAGQSNMGTMSSYGLGAAGEFETDGTIASKTTSGETKGVVIGNCYRDSAGVVAPIGLAPNSICLGTGSTEVDYNDFKLSGEAISYSLTFIKRDIEWDPNAQKFKHSAVFSCTNTGNEDVTIREWGIYRPLSSNSSTTSTYNNNDYNITLMFREVLSSPITIAAQTTGTFKLELDVPMPNHP